ncbi:MAG: 30S ribosomal protein S18 [Candidatus Yonathbacteria bacterium RIFOXYC1_FULL_52_10]|nr:MAG: 30S ribosomal protein S18 [Candidatus Yonathbacteria bacterium RIFOXYC1_FULL_52_10]
MTQCFFTQNNISHIDYKNTEILRKFLTPASSIMPRKRSGVCSKHQRLLATAVKRSRFMGLLPYVSK